MDGMTHVLMVIGFVIMLGVAGRFDCDAAQGLTSPNMIWLILLSVALMIPEAVWYLYMIKKAKETEE